MPTRVLVTPRSLTRAGLLHVPALAPLHAAGIELVAGPAGRQPTHDELLSLVPGCTGWIAGVEPVDSEVLAGAKDLRVISRWGAGTDAIDLVAAQRHGIVVERAAGANARGVAELTVAHVLAGLRGVTPASRALVAGRWERPEGRELAECTVGVVGLGAVGRLVAHLLAALGARVVGHDPYVDAVPGVALLPLPALLGVSDVVTLHCPPGDRALLGAGELAALPTGAVLVNTARSSLVDDDAVLAALESGRLAAYAVDAFDREPPEVTPLLRHPRVLATPHLGAHTSASTQRVGEVAVANLLRHLGAS